MLTVHDRVAEAATDIAEAMKKYHLAAVFGWQDIAQRYRRSKVGAFWLSINMAVLIAAIGLIFGTLFRSPMQDFLPYLCIGIIIWGFISTTLAESCLGFIAAEGIILQVRMPLFTHIMRLVWRNIIIFSHNVVVFPVVMLMFLHPLSWIAPLAILGLILVALNLLWIALVLSVICTRYRDMTQVVQNALQVIFYATPVIWKQESLPAGISQYLLMLNPFYHFVNVVRSPLLGAYPTALNWAVCLFLMIVGWIAAILFFGSYRKRIAYWL
jgi:lipopolysaccharide transport system permease protein